MRALELPYPLLVGRVAGGEWSSQVPDRLEFEGRVGVPRRRGRRPPRAPRSRPSSPRRSTTARRRPRSPGPAARSRPARRRADHPWARARARPRSSDERGRPARVAGVPWGADMRLFAARGIPCVMAGTSGIERAHAVDERVAVDELVTVARAIVRVVFGFA